MCFTHLTDMGHSCGEKICDEQPVYEDIEAAVAAAGGDSEGPPAKKRRTMRRHGLEDYSYPHRLEALTSLGVAIDTNCTHDDNSAPNWENMFRKLVSYKDEHGTLHFPSEEKCAATGDVAVIALQKWAKSQALAYWDGKMKPAAVKRLTDIGFDFEEWRASLGKERTRGGKKKKEIKDRDGEDVGGEGDRKSKKTSRMGKVPWSPERREAFIEAVVTGKRNSVQGNLVTKAKNGENVYLIQCENAACGHKKYATIGRQGWKVSCVCSKSISSYKFRLCGKLARDGKTVVEVPNIDEEFAQTKFLSPCYKPRAVER